MPIVYHVFFVEIRLTSSQLALIRQYISLHSRSNAVSNQVREILKQQNLGGGTICISVSHSKFWRTRPSIIIKLLSFKSKDYILFYFVSVHVVNKAVET